MSPLPRVLRLDSAVRDYAWGSKTALQTMLGMPVDGRPAAELWLGAHPSEPSRWADHQDRPGLDELIAADPVAMLGAPVAERFDGTLPFLLKLLAAGKALSLQVHPNLEQARAGFADEQARGVPLAAPERNYSDPNHKPELLCALTEFEAFCGFRPIESTVELLSALVDSGATELARYRDNIQQENGIRCTFTTILSLPPAVATGLLESVLAGAAVLAESDGPWAPEARACLLAAGDFPGDIGPVITLLLNYLRLQPGEAIFLAAGNVHAYLRGFGVEILANSDNVLRCGLTPKHIDVAELLRIADLSPLVEPTSAVEIVSPSVRRYPVPVPDFELSRVSPSGSAVPLADGVPQVVVGTEGRIVVAPPGADEQVLAPGQAVFVRPAPSAENAGGAPVPAGVVLSGDGVAFVATVGR